MAKFDATEVLPGLWQGAAPPVGQSLAKRGFNVLVLSAIEHQIPADLYEGLEAVIYVPLHDDGSPPTQGERVAAYQAGRSVADYVRAGRKVLVTCWMGLNRSGLITALAMSELLPTATPDAIVATIRRARHGALGNSWFVRMIQSYPRTSYLAARRRPVSRGKYSRPR